MAQRAQRKIYHGDTEARSSGPEEVRQIRFDRTVCFLEREGAGKMKIFHTNTQWKIHHPLCWRPFDTAQGRRGDTEGFKSGGLRNPAARSHGRPAFAHGVIGRKMSLISGSCRLHGSNRSCKSRICVNTPPDLYSVSLCLRGESFPCIDTDGNSGF